MVSSRVAKAGKSLVESFEVLKYNVSEESTVRLWTDVGAQASVASAYPLAKDPQDAREYIYGVGLASTHRGDGPLLSVAANSFSAPFQAGLAPWVFTHWASGEGCIHAKPGSLLQLSSVPIGSFLSFSTDAEFLQTPAISTVVLVKVRVKESLQCADLKVRTVEMESPLTRQPALEAWDP